MSGISRTTTDHSIIRRWAEARGGVPSRVPGTEENSAGVLRIRFDKQAELERIAWGEFFEKFDSENLALVYQEATSDGAPSRFCKLVTR